MRKFLRAGFSSVVLLTGALGVSAQTISINATTPATSVSCSSVSASTAVNLSKVNSVMGNPKAQQLLNDLRSRSGATFTADYTRGLSVSVSMRIAQGSSSATPKFTYTLVPLNISGSSRIFGLSATLMAIDIEGAPGLSFVRLLTKQSSNAHLVSEYGYLKDGRVYLMTAQRADAVFRSGNIVLNKTIPSAGASIENLTRAMVPNDVFSVLSKCYDYRSSNVASRELLLASSLVSMSTLGDEFSASYVTGQVNISPLFQGGNAVWQQWFKDLFKDIVKELGKKLLGWIIGLF